MKIMRKIQEKQKDIFGAEPVTVAFLGDSGTQGCFECFFSNENTIQTVFEYQNAYSTRFKELLNMLYPRVQINIIKK